MSSVDTSPCGGAAAAPHDTGLDSLHHLRGRLAVVRERVAALVEHRRRDDPDPDDPYRGLYVSDAHVDAMLAGPITPVPRQVVGSTGSALASVEDAADAAEARGADIRLRTLADRFELDALDVEVLLVALAPDLDARYERLYGYLNDDVTRRRATVGLVLELLGLPPSDGAARARLGPAGPLRAGALVVVEDDPGRGVLTSEVRMAERVVAHLSGGDAIDEVVTPLCEPVSYVDLPEVDVVVRALAGRSRLAYLRDRVGSSSVAAASEAVRRATGRTPLVVDLGRLPVREDVARTVDALVREARLAGTGIVAGPIEELAALDRRALRSLVDAPLPRVLVGDGGWNSAWGDAVPLVLDGPIPGIAHREAMWREAVAAVDAEIAVGLNPGVAALAFRLTPEQILRSTRSASTAARAEDRPVEESDLRAGARAQNAVGLERLARRIEPRATWEDLVVPDRVLIGLREVAARSRHRDLVLREWGMGGKTGRGQGVTGLLAGVSGTGKTMAAEVIAGDLGLDLYVIDLSTVVDKYIGETEKNLDRVFGEADRVNGVLLFDEADALFGKRSEVSDSKDRHANVEVAYLLQRMEQFDGIALLTTNLRANLDDAFTRRLDAIIDFALPERDERAALWRKNLHGRLPLGEVDLDFLADRFRLSGGEIRNIAVTAAYLAAEEGCTIGMHEIVQATAREYRKLGRLTDEAEFGRYLQPASDQADAGAPR